jgi:hypothetical protein
MSIGTEVNTVITTAENDVKVIFKDVESVLTMPIGTATTATGGAVKNVLTKRVDIFGAKIAVNKRFVKVFAEMACVAALAIGLIGTQVYVYMDHKKAIELNSGRTSSLESLTKQFDTDFTNVNSAIITTNKIVNSVQTAQKADEAKLAQIQAELNSKLSPVHATSAVSRKYFRKK